MVNQKDAQLDLVFAALSDATRRRVLEQLGSGGASVSELAAPHGMSLPGFMKHLAVLEAAGLIARAKEGRVVRCELDAAPMQAAAAWISHYEHFWGEQLDALGRYLHHEQEVTPCKQAHSKPQPRSASTGTTRSPSKKSGARGPTRRP
ncbi:ArsR/SmtB family transcription factor [Roseateles saccharophilus]|uniref:ArsR/SmtB family transcription factor n=1 Tax=Roseateles saccharophilus TaxID=304 RepID=UPI00104AAEAD|nr:metalloregulator ArsR/SmtB family transcription factor [Roseateles saccharophilus]MDG0833354.1 transcriptional regulator [Roseateles saccharophilus]